MKPLIKSIIAASILGLVYSPLSFAQEDSLPSANINIVGTWANLSIYKEREQPFWAKTIPEKSKGSIKTNIRAFTEMGLKGGEVFRLMGSGVIEFGSTVLGYVAGDDPENEAVDLAGFSADIGVARQVSDAWKPILADLYEEKHGIKLLALFPFHAQVIYCKSPINSLDDLRGKKVRTFSKSLSEFVDAVGGTGINIPFGEVVPALQKGLADCAITGSLSGNLAKWHEVTDYLYELPVGWSMVMHGVNLKTWDSLPEQVRTFLENEIALWEDEVWLAATAETQAGLDCNTGKECTAGIPAKMNLIQVSDKDQKRLRNIMETVIVPKWAKRCGEACVSQWNDTVGKIVGITASSQ